jgi:hypothetical protein
MPTDRPPISPSRLRRGVILFLGFSAVGLVFLINRSSLQSTVENLVGFDRRFLALAVALLLLDWVVSGTRIWIFARKVERGVSFGGCVRSCLVNIFVGGATPSQTGGAPAQIYVLHREGLGVFDATVAAFLGGFLGTSVVLMVAAFVFSVLVEPPFVGSGLRVLSTISLTVFSMVVLLVLLSLANPRAVGRAVRGAARHTPWLGRRLQARGKLDGILGLAQRYHDLMTGFILREKLVVALGILLSVLIYFNKFAIAYVVLRGLGIEAPFWQVIYMQVVLMLIFYFSPTPGASGVAEVSTAAVMGALVPVADQSAFIVLWRFFTLVVGMIVGAGVLLRYFSRE